MKTRNNFVIGLLVLTICAFNASTLYSQNNKNTLYIYTGFAYGQPDIRYDFLFDQNTTPGETALTVIENAKNTTLDDEYFVGLTYRFALLDRINIGLGVGYAQLIQDFLLPADGNGYFRETKKPTFWRDESQYHMAQFSPTIDIKILNKSLVLGLNSTGVSNISFRKHINRFNLSRNTLENFASEVYTGAYIEFKGVRFDYGYRVLHAKYRDDAIANNGLDRDTFNPRKMRFQLSYKVFSW
jgi:hypothetical protein